MRLQVLNRTNQYDIDWNVDQSDYQRRPGTQIQQMQDVAEKHQSWIRDNKYVTIYRPLDKQPRAQQSVQCHHR